MSSTENKKILDLRPLSSLAKVFPYRIYGKKTTECLAVSGQEVSFQIAYRLSDKDKYRQRDLTIKLKGEFKDIAALHTVGLVPSVLSAFPERNDDNYISKDCGMFPDPLFPVKNNTISAAAFAWRSLWVSIKIPEDCPTGAYNTEIYFSLPNGATQKASFRPSKSFSLHSGFTATALQTFTELEYSQKRIGHLSRNICALRQSTE